MKNVLLFLLLTPTCFAGVEVKEKLIHTVSETSNVLLNSETARCSDLGYGNLQLKVTVPDLAWMAIYNHSNLGEGLPCISAGSCRDKLMPGNLVDPARPYESITIKIAVVEKFTLDNDKKTCTRVVEERVNSNIRGIPFFHLRTGGYSEMPYEVCASK